MTIVHNSRLKTLLDPFPLLALMTTLCWTSVTAAQAAAYPRIEAAFDIPNLTSDPFDYEKTDVRVQIRRSGGDTSSGGTVTVPAFFDGGTTWRVRHTPSASGRYTLAAITLNGQAIQVAARLGEWQAGGTPAAGFVRLDPQDRQRFILGNGARYFPLGHNQAWQGNRLPDIPALFVKMGAAGENWSRVWMNHWDNKNLDWPKSGPLGQLNLDVARRWDAIVESAQQNGIFFQMALQHHGQYSTQVNPNWDDNPYSVKNGGFLQKPEEFFSSPQAKALTKRKLRYAVARWGYSPSIMAWELFNEVQFTDAARQNQWDVVAAWHREMAGFLRRQDVYHHLITTSSVESVPPSVWTTMDYYQEHAYPADLLTALNAGNSQAGNSQAGDSQAGNSHSDAANVKPFFVGEFGPASLRDDQGILLHAGLWASLMSGNGGAAQYWAWDTVEGHDLYRHFRAASGFLAASRLAERSGLKKTMPPIVTATQASLSFGPGGGWAPVKQNEFVVDPGGPPAGIGALPRFLQGSFNRTLSPKPWVFRVTYPQPGQFTVHVAQVAKAGAHVKLSVDGQAAVERDFSAADREYTPQGAAGQIAVNVPAGAHVITLENTGDDWAAIQRFTLTGYSPALAAYALSGSDFAAAWVYHRENVTAATGRETPASSGTISFSGLKPGRYRATWWDTHTGKPLQSTLVTLSGSGRVLAVGTPSIVRDAALYVSGM